MRVAYYTHTAFFEPALCLVRELSRRVTLDLLLEISPGAWQSAAFDLPGRDLPAGLIPADPILGDAVPPGVRRYWQAANSFHLVVHPARRSFHPSSWRVSRQALAFARGADVLHVDDVDVSPRLALGLPGGSHPPLVVNVHDPEPHSGEGNWRRAVARRLAYPRAARFLLFNRAQRDAFATRHRVPPGRVAVTHLGLYDVLREWAPPAPDEPRTVTFFGRLSPYKGLDLFYDAAQQVAARVADVTFVVAGRPVSGYVPPRPPPLASGRVETIERYLTTADAARLLRQSRVVVCPYRDATQSGVVLSAFAFGVPVVATDVGGLGDYVRPEQTGLLVPGGDAAALADALTRVLQEPKLAARLRAGIADAAEGELSWQRTADALLAMYAEC